MSKAKPIDAMMRISQICNVSGWGGGNAGLAGGLGVLDTFDSLSQ